MSTTTATELQAKAVNATARFLDRRGYEILERGWECAAGSVDLITLDEEGVLVFVEVSAAEGALPEKAATEAGRRRREAQAVAYLTEAAPESDCGVRFDDVAIAVVGEGRALVRHHVNAYGSETR